MHLLSGLLVYPAPVVPETAALKYTLHLCWFFEQFRVGSLGGLALTQISGGCTCVGKWQLFKGRLLPSPLVGVMSSNKPTERSTGGVAGFLIEIPSTNACLSTSSPKYPFKGVGGKGGISRKFSENCSNLCVGIGGRLGIS